MVFIYQDDDVSAKTSPPLYYDPTRDTLPIPSCHENFHRLQSFPGNQAMYLCEHPRDMYCEQRRWEVFISENPGGPPHCTCFIEAKIEHQTMYLRELPRDMYNFIEDTDVEDIQSCRVPDIDKILKRRFRIAKVGRRRRASPLSNCAVSLQHL